MQRPSSSTLIFVLCLAAASFLWPTPARAQWSPYPYRWAAPESDLRVVATPKNAAVYVDGYFAGLVDEFDGTFQRLRVTPGQHQITLYLEGYRTVSQKVYLQLNRTQKLQIDMEKLLAGEASEPVPPPAPQTEAPAPPTPQGWPPAATPDPRWPQPRMPRPGTPPASPQPPPAPREAPAEAFSLGTLSLRVKPGGTEILIDGQRQPDTPANEVLLVQLAEGPHRVEVQKQGYEPFSDEFEVRRGETTAVNVVLVRK